MCDYHWCIRDSILINRHLSTDKFHSKERGTKGTNFIQIIDAECKKAFFTAFKKSDKTTKVKIKKSKVTMTLMIVCEVLGWIDPKNGLKLNKLI